MNSEASSTPSSGSRIARILLLVCGAALLADALVLMAMRHFNVGVVVPAALGLAALLLSWKWQVVRRWRAARPLNAKLWALGSGTLNGHPRPVLAARLDTAAELAKLQPSALIAVCGGVDWGEKESEAEVMARYLEQYHGIAADRLVLEKLSTSTELNLKLSRPLLAERGIAADAPMAMVSSDFHLMRALDIAKRQDLTKVYPVAAPTPLATRFNAWLREYFAMASSWLLGEV